LSDRKGSSAPVGVWARIDLCEALEKLKVEEGAIELQCSICRTVRDVTIRVEGLVDNQIRYSEGKSYNNNRVRILEYSKVDTSRKY